MADGMVEQATVAGKAPPMVAAALSHTVEPPSAKQRTSAVPTYTTREIRM
jgi:hypothetical protein